MGFLDNFGFTDIAGDLVGGGLGILGGMLSNQRNKQNAEIAFQRQFDAQNWFNTHAIQQKVADANAAGISPLAALGVNPASGPSASAFTDSVGPALGNMGQNIARALRANEDDEGKQAQINLLKAQTNFYNSRAQKDQETKPMQSGSSDAADSPDVGETKGPESTGLRYNGLELLHAPDTSDAQDFNNRYDDKVSEFVGAATFPRDLTFTLAIRGDLGEAAEVEAWNLWTRWKAGKRGVPKPPPRPPSAFDDPFTGGRFGFTGYPRR